MPKTDLLRKYQAHKKDTGSAEVQIILISNKINELADHLKQHKKDNSSRLGLVKLVAKRRRLLNYLSKTNEEQYKKLIIDLKLRR